MALPWASISPVRTPLPLMQRQTDILGHWSCGYRNVRERTSSPPPFSLPPYLEGQASPNDPFVARPSSLCSPRHALDMARQLQMLSSSLTQQRAEFKRVITAAPASCPRSASCTDGSR